MISTKNIEILPPAPPETTAETRQKIPFYFKLFPLAFASLGRLFPSKAAQLAERLFSTPHIRAVHKTSDEWIEGARRSEMPYGGISLKYYEWGQGEKTILLVHGWESRGTALRSFVPGLLKAGYRVVAFDGPAHGDSGGRRTNWLDFAGAVKAAIEKAGSVSGIIAHSFGGATTAFALAYLDNTIQLEKLALVAVPASNRRVIAQFEKIIRLPLRARAIFHRNMEAQLDGLSIADTDAVQALQRAHVGRILIVHDKLDRSVSFKSAEIFFEKCENTDLLVTEGYGHFKLMRQAEVVEKVVAFIG